jgi:hypothetical protein
MPVEPATLIAAQREREVAAVTTKFAWKRNLVMMATPMLAGLVMRLVRNSEQVPLAAMVNIVPNLNSATMASMTVAEPATVRATRRAVVLSAAMENIALSLKCVMTGSQTYVVAATTIALERV